MLRGLFGLVRPCRLHFFLGFVFILLAIDRERREMFTPLVHGHSASEGHRISELVWEGVTSVSLAAV